MTAPTRDNVTGAGRRFGYGVLLGDNWFQLAVAPDRKVEVVTAPLEAPRVNTGVAAEDFSNEFGTRFSRSDFSGGEGLLFAHRANAGDSDASRYYDSQNVDFLDDGTVTLLKAPEVSDGLTASGIRLAAADGSLWATNGTSTRRTDDPETNATWAADDPHLAEGASTVTDLVGVGTTIYAAVADGIHRKTSGGAWVHWHTRAGIDRLWTAKGRVLAAVDNILYAYDTGATPTETAVLTIAVGETFNDLCDAGTHVLVTATDGYIHALAEDATTVFAVAGQTQRGGETPYGIASQDGVVVFGTSTPIEGSGATGRLYSGVLEGAVLSGIQRLRTWEGTSTVDRTPHAVAVFGDSMYVSVTESATVGGLWRYDLSTAAVHRSYRLDSDPTVRDIRPAGGKLYWSVDATGVVRPSDAFHSDGHLTGPLGDLFTAQEKSWASIATSFSGLTGTGEALVVKYTTSTTLDSVTWRRLTRYTSGDRTVDASLPNVESRYLSVRLDFESSSDGSLAPTLRGFSARAYPQSDELIIRFPVNVSDQIERRGKARVNAKGRGREVLDALVALEGASTTCELPHLGESLRGVVESVERPYSTLASMAQPSVFAVVTFRGSRVTEDASTEGLALMGTYFNGLGLMGTSPAMAKAS